MPLHVRRIGDKFLEAAVEAEFIRLGWPAADVSCRVGSHADGTPVVGLSIFEDPNLEHEDAYAIACHALGHRGIEVRVTVNGLEDDGDFVDDASTCLACKYTGLVREAS